MSKSDDNPGSYVAVLDEPDVIIKSSAGLPTAKPGALAPTTRVSI